MSFDGLFDLTPFMIGLWEFIAQNKWIAGNISHENFKNLCGILKTVKNSSGGFPSLRKMILNTNQKTLNFQ